jgi:lysophospholipase L1-like esterase
MVRRWGEAPPVPGSVVFYGSSSIRLWSSLTEDFPDLPVVNAGFGGSTLAACAHFFDRLVVPLAPRSLLVYAGDNDIGDGRTPGDVLSSLRALLARFDVAFPGVPLGFLSIKPSPARWPLHGAIAEANELARVELTSRSNRFYVDLVPAMLGEDGKPRPELYAEDGLHLSAAGYRLWAEVVGRFRGYFDGSERRAGDAGQSPAEEADGT